MQEIITHGLMTFGAGFTAAALTKAKGPGQALDDIMSLVGFERLHEVAEKKRSDRELSIKKYKESIAQKIASIPEDKLQEPSLSVVGPALEASKYYIEEKILREMFSNVISASMDKSKSPVVHHSFVEIIKQLSPDDAQFLKEFKNNRLPYGKVLIVENKSDKPELSLKELADKEKFDKYFSYKSSPFIDYFYYSSTRNDWENNELNISLLSRLGLINIQEKVTLSNNLIYVEIEKEFDLLKKRPELVDGSEIVPTGFHLELIKGTIDLTPFGKSFFHVCI